MKGVVFTEFLEMVEAQYSLTIVDELVLGARLPSGGSYTAVGTYPASEMVALVSELSRRTQRSTADILRQFGRYLLHRFAQGYPQFFSNVSSSFVFLENVENYIHQEVKKLYPDAELPTFECEAVSDSRLRMTYRSPRCLADLAEGLMLGCAEHFGEKIEVAREDLSGGTGQVVRFTLTRSSPA